MYIESSLDAQWRTMDWRWLSYSEAYILISYCQVGFWHNGPWCNGRKTSWYRWCNYGTISEWNEGLEILVNKYLIPFWAFGNLRFNLLGVWKVRWLDLYFKTTSFYFFFHYLFIFCLNRMAKKFTINQNNFFLWYQLRFAYWWLCFHDYSHVTCKHQII